MAVDRKQFTEIVEKGLKANSTYTKFYLNFKLDGVSKQKVLDYSQKQWDKRTRVSNAKSQLLLEKNKELNNGLNFTENSSLNNVADIYFDLACDDTDWTTSRKDAYTLYCRDKIGKKKIKSIRKVDIDALRKSMEKKGHSKQTKNGCSPRTIKKILIQVLKPILVYAMENKVISDIPTIKAPAQTRRKKTVENASDKLINLYNIILSLYKDDPFYRALFLFALFGRRWNEIRTLSWSDINMDNNKYIIRSENNKVSINQTYDLAPVIKEALLEFKDQSHLVFASPSTGKELYPPKRQLQKIKDLSIVKNLTMHYFRHILVSAMGETGVATTILSAALGHTNSETVNDFYLSANHTKASTQANTAIDAIVST